MKSAKAKALIALAFAIATLDGALKFLAITRLPEEGGRISFPIDFLLHKNPGIAFDTPVPLPIVFILTAIILIIITRYGIKSWKLKPKLSVASSFIIAGALGNVIDRIINGFTTDYIILFGRSAINLADILIITGTILLLWYSEGRSERKI